MRAQLAVASRPKVGQLTAVYARPDSSVLDIPGLRAAADGGIIAPAQVDEFIPLPQKSLLLVLPGRSLAAFDDAARFVTVDDVEGEEACAVAAALPPGFTRTLLPAYVERRGAPPLPLYGYTAVAWYRGQFWVAATRTDATEAWMPSAHAEAAVRSALPERMKEFGSNGLITQLARCAIEYGCYTAQNVFLRQGEAAIVVSPACNARCVGCISEQEPETGVEAAQARVRRVPSVKEIADLAVAHLTSAERGIVSFGQGCEGEPLLAAARIADAIRAIRKRTNAGTLHCNTNASRPQALRELIDAGLQSIRVSLNSARPEAYAAYYRPRGYDFSDVCESVRVAAESNISISLNLLTHPGVTDDPREIEAFGAFLHRFPIAMVQTRTLNIDPAQYFAAVGRPSGAPLGMRQWFAWMRETFPNVRLGNFTRGFG